MEKISKQEALELNKLGVKFGDGGISKTYSGHSTYYLCTNKFNMDKLNKLRKDKVVR